MKKETFDLLEKLRDKIQEVRDNLEYVRDEEEMAYDNLPEGIQMGERGDMMQEAIDTIDEAVYSLDDAISSMDLVCDDTDRDLLIGTSPWDNLKEGDRVIHKTFGEGAVVSNDGKYLKVQFARREGNFLLPDAFEKGFLRLQ